MNVLIVNNKTEHVDELKKLFPSGIIATSEMLKGLENKGYFDCVVISGGSHTPTVLRHPKYYEREIQFIKKLSVPLLCICLGTELLVYTYGGTLRKLSRKQLGKINLSIEDDSLARKLHATEISVYEAHGIGIETLPEHFVSCAHSTHGIEIIKHISKPIVGIQFHPEVSVNKKLFEWIFETLDVRKNA